MRFKWLRSHSLPNEDLRFVGAFVADEPERAQLVVTHPICPDCLRGGCNCAECWDARHCGQTQADGS